MKTPSKRFEYFQGSFVYILTKSLRSTINKTTGSVIIEGFVYDECEDCFYLTASPESDEVIDSVQKDEIVRMFVPHQEMMELMATEGYTEGDLN